MKTPQFDLRKHSKIMQAISEIYSDPDYFASQVLIGGCDHELRITIKFKSPEQKIQEGSEDKFLYNDSLD